MDKYFIILVSDDIHKDKNKDTCKSRLVSLGKKKRVLSWSCKYHIGGFLVCFFKD